MPRGKKNKRNNNQDALTTRLMQLSLKMDDHIYCNKVIPVATAEEYLQEIANMKCPRTNVRALQVIEKLTRYMKGVIAGDQIPAGYVPLPHVEAHKELPEPCPHIYSLPEPCSPVYSLADEDKTELLTENRFIDNQIIDLTDDDTAIQEHDDLIEKVKNAISNMGLRDEVQADIADVDSSQSILDNFHNDNTVMKFHDGINQQPDYYVICVANNQPEQVTNEIVEEVNNHPEGTAFERNCSQSVLDMFCSQSTKYSEPSQDKDLELNQNITETHLVTQQTLAKETNNAVTITDTLATPQPIYFVEASNVSEKIVSNVKRPAEPPTQEAKKENNKVRRKKKKDCNDVAEKQKSQSKAKKTNKENHPRKGRKDNKVHGTGVDRSELAIYNKNVECDLSWVENLRYVREISPEENDTTLSIFDENFWNNFSLPDNWNDRDFEG